MKFNENWSRGKTVLYKVEGFSVEIFVNRKLNAPEMSIEFFLMRGGQTYSGLSLFFCKTSELARFLCEWLKALNSKQPMSHVTWYQEIGFAKGELYCHVQIGNDTATSMLRLGFIPDLYDKLTHFIISNFFCEGDSSLERFLPDEVRQILDTRSEKYAAKAIEDFFEGLETIQNSQELSERAKKLIEREVRRQLKEPSIDELVQAELDAIKHKENYDGKE